MDQLDLVFSADDPSLLPEGAKPVMSEHRMRAMPLWQFPASHLERIMEEVRAPRPPEKWIYFGAPGSSRPIASMQSRAWWEWHWQRGIDPDKRRASLPPSLRQMVIDRDGYVCGLCGGEVDPADVHIDHILPVKHGGRDVLGNLQVAHSWCNLSKGARI